MIEIKKKSKCSGCHACVNICPKKCISMKSDSEGFLYPVVDKSKCIKCGLCKKACHNLNKQKSTNSPDAYACFNLDEKVRLSSSSGGMFTLLAEEIIGQGGVVFGAVFDDDLAVKHDFVDKKEDIYKLRGSKYVQSIIGDTYKRAKEILQTGRLVLFTGTPCQIEGLLMYLGKDYDNLYTQDIICHGVPSPKVWEIYLRHQQTLHKCRIDNTSYPSFRSKDLGWLNFSLKIQFENKEEYNESHGKDIFMNAFLKNLCLRPSCYNCNCKSIHKNSDITLADFWGVNLLIPDMFDDKGTSLVFVNTEKGRKLFDKTKENITYRKTDIKTAVRYNPLAYMPSYRPLKRTKFMKNIDSCDFTKLQKACSKRSIFERVYNRSKRILMQYLNNI